MNLTKLDRDIVLKTSLSAALMKFTNDSIEPNQVGEFTSATFNNVFSSFGCIKVTENARQSILHRTTLEKPQKEQDELSSNGQEALERRDVWLFILFSLFLQVLLIFLAPIRKRKLSRWLNPFIWACYLLADWVVAFSLGLLSDSQNNNNNLHSSNTNKELQGFWAPFLLLHLGGPDTITAFALEDNELWPRHLVGLLFQVGMACYVFSREFPMERLLIPTLLVFFAGTVKYGERTRALYLASIGVYGFRETIDGKADPGPNYAKLVSELTSRTNAGLLAKIIFEKQHTILTIVDDDEEPTIVDDEEPTLNNIEVITNAHRFVKKFKGIIANLIGSFNDRRDNQAYFSGAYFKEQGITSKDAFSIVEAELNFIYEDISIPRELWCILKLPMSCVLFVCVTTTNQGICDGIICDDTNSSQKEDIWDGIYVTEK